MTTPAIVLRLFVCMIGSLLLIGCQGTGRTINFEPHALSTRTTSHEALQADTLTIVVAPFQDARAQQTRLGSRTHLWGGVTHFDAWNGNISEGMADLALQYLQQKKWQALRAPAVQDDASLPHDVKLTGTVLALKANAKSGFGFTDLRVDMKVRFEATNNIDGSTVRMVLGANGSDTVGLFDPTDVERLINVVAKDLFQQLFQDLMVKDKAFQLRPGAA